MNHQTFLSQHIHFPLRLEKLKHLCQNVLESFAQYNSIEFALITNDNGMGAFPINSDRQITKDSDSHKHIKKYPNRFLLVLNVYWL